MLLAVFVAAANQTVVTTAMPGIVLQFGEFARYTWPTVSFLLAAAVGMLAGGRIGEGYGSGRVIAFGLAVFLAGCLAVSFAQSMTALIALRTVEGFGIGDRQRCIRRADVAGIRARCRSVRSGRTDVRYGVLIRLSGSGMLFLAFVSADTDPAAIAAYSVVAGVGMGGLLAALTVLVQQLLAAVVASASAALQYCRLLGGLIGLTVLGDTMGWRFERRVTGGWTPRWRRGFRATCWNPVRTTRGCYSAWPTKGRSRATCWVSPQ